MKRYRWHLMLALWLLLASAIVYSLQLLIFENPSDTFFYLFQDLAFVPISVLLVTLVIDKLMKKREKRSLINKMNMVVGTFFSEMGNTLLGLMIRFDCESNDLKGFFAHEEDWSDKFLSSLKKYVQSHEFHMMGNAGDLKELKDFLQSKRDFLMGLLGNPNLLEHETFTDLLWATSHLTEELAFRGAIDALSDDDIQHLANDVKRAYVSLLKEWLDYMKHLRDDYPYMFALAVEKNPLEPHGE